MDGAGYCIPIVTIFVVSLQYICMYEREGGRVYGFGKHEGTGMGGNLNFISSSSIASVKDAPF
jgi:hypothetical protein